MKFLGKIDWYIIRKFIGSYFFSIFLILSIAVVLDLNSKLDDFLKPNVTLYEIVFHYYANFVAFYANLFSPLFVFISVIFFTSKMAENNEIISMLSTGVGFKRMLRPYMFSALIIASLSFVLSNFIIPAGTKVRINFEDKYIKNRKVKYASIIQMEIDKGTIMFMSSYNNENNKGYQFALEKYNGKDLVSRLTAEDVEYKGENLWTLNDFRIRTFTEKHETDTVGYSIDSIINVSPSDFLIGKYDMNEMTTPQLISHISRLKSRGVGNVSIFEIERDSRLASVFSSFILAFIGVVLSAKKKKNGIGINIALGIVLCFIYIFLLSVSSTFATGGSMPTYVAAWIPNILFSVIGLSLWKKAPR